MKVRVAIPAHVVALFFPGTTIGTHSSQEPNIAVSRSLIDRFRFAVRAALHRFVAASHNGVTFARVASATMGLVFLGGVQYFRIGERGLQ